MDQDLETFRQLVLWLWEHHKKPRGYSKGGASAIYDEIEKVYQSVPNRPMLENELLPSEERVRTAFGRMYLYLDPVAKGCTMVPVLWAKCDFGRSPAEVRLRLGLFRWHDGGVKAIGYRFETPEGKGSHNYYHVQVLQRLDGPFPPAECSSWLPDSQPAFPLDADDPVKLLLCLLASLYGVQSVARLRTADYLGTQLKPYLDEMFCNRPKPFCWYWKVESKKGGKRPGYHCCRNKTPEEAEEWLDKLKKAHPGNRFLGITKGRWDGISDTKKQVH